MGGMNSLAKIFNNGSAPDHDSVPGITEYNFCDCRIGAVVRILYPTP